MAELFWMLLLYYVTIASSVSPQQPEGCSVAYDTATSRVSFNFDWKQQTGPPGIQGPAGPPGPKGETGSNGLVQSDMLTGFEAKIQQLQMKIDQLTNPQRIEKLYQRFKDGWKAGGNGYLYYISQAGLTWRQAVMYCAGLDAKLAAVGPRNTAMFTLLWNLAPTNGRLWIGLSDIAAEGTWEWIDGISSNSSNTLWLDGQPDNHGIGQDCAVVFEKWKAGFDDLTCLSISPRALCEIAVP